MPPRRPILGLLVDRLEDYYQNTILWAVAGAAAERGADVVCFAGGVLGSPDRFALQRNGLFELPGPDNVDGLLILAGTIGNTLGAEELARYCERYHPLPMCSIAVALDGIPSVLVDNDSGMREAMHHLIDAHAAKRIAFVRGPAANEDAEQRYRVYRGVLSDKGLVADPSLVVEGDFERESGREAVRVLLDERVARMDALVAASDDMAIGAIEALGERGVEVPGQVSVVSFDDDEAARLCTPPLTTVHVPLEGQAQRAVGSLLGLIEGATIRQRDVLPTSLVVRESCGCMQNHNQWESCSRQERSLMLEQAQAAERAQAQQRIQAERWARLLGDTGKALITSFDQDSLVDSLVRQLGRLQIPSCHLSLFVGEDRTRSRTLLAYEDGQVRSLPDDVYPSAQLVPCQRGSWRPGTYVVEPLFFEQEPIGLAVFEAGPREGNIYESLRDQISAAIKGAALLEQVVEEGRQRRQLVGTILDVTPDLHRVQPVSDLTENILGQLVDLMGGQAVHGLLALLGEDLELAIQAGVGRFAESEHLEEGLDSADLKQVDAAMADGEICWETDRIIIPLRVGELTLGVVYLERAEVAERERELDLIRILANQATVAIQNIRLYEMATLDPLTGVHARRFLDRWLQREIRTALRSGQELSLILLDMDDMKGINDSAGHLAGDQALATLGKALRQATRSNDVVGRYGGDEFVVVLPGTDQGGAERVARRIQELLAGAYVVGPDGDIPIRVSVGVTTLVPGDMPVSEPGQPVPAEYFVSVARDLIQEADEALYRAKRDGRNRIRSHRSYTQVVANG